MYLSQKIAQEESSERRQELLTAVRNGSVTSWRHVNLHGEYDLSVTKIRGTLPR